MSTTYPLKKRRLSLPSTAAERLRLLSILLFLASLPQRVCLTQSSGNSDGWFYGGQLLLLGLFFGVCVPYVAWFANPPLVAAWILMSKPRRGILALSFAILSLALACCFPLQKQFMRDEAGNMSDITRYASGYYWWLASIATALVACIVSVIRSHATQPHLDSMGRSDLHYAAHDANTTLVLQLLKKGADLSLADANGWTPLHFAAQSQSASTILALLTAGATVDARDRNGNTPLWTATCNCTGNGDAITALRAANADPLQKNNYDITPLSLAHTIANYNITQFYADLPAPKPQQPPTIE